MHDQMKHAGDAAAGLVALGTIAAWLPPVAALFTLVWTGFRLAEMWTGKKVHEFAWVVRAKTAFRRRRKG